MPAFSHFFLKRLSARSKFSSSWIMTSDKFYFPPSWRLLRRLLDRLVNLGGTRGWVKQQSKINFERQRCEITEA
jgi:hypothetical protein